MRKLTFSLLLIAAMPAAAWAQPYAKLTLGYANAEFPLGAPYNGIIDDTSLMYGLDVGLGFGEKWAVEFGADAYTGFDGIATPCSAGDTCDPTTQQISNNDQTVYKASLLRRFTIGPVQMYGKAGYYQAHVEANIDQPDADFDPDGLLLGVGIMWYFRDPWHVTLEATRLDDNVSQLSLGVGWGMRSLFGSDRGNSSDARASNRSARRN